MISFPKKSFYFQSEVLNLLSISDKELKQFCRQGLQSLFSDNGKKIFLREDIINLFATGIVSSESSQAKNNKSIVSEVEQVREDKYSNHKSQLLSYRQSIESALSMISKIKSEHPQIWYNH